MCSRTWLCKWPADAAALRVLTRYAIIEGRDMATEALPAGEEREDVRRRLDHLRGGYRQSQAS